MSSTRKTYFWRVQIVETMFKLILTPHVDSSANHINNVTWLPLTFWVSDSAVSTWDGLQAEGRINQKRNTETADVNQLSACFEKVGYGIGFSVAEMGKKRKKIEKVESPLSSLYQKAMKCQKKTGSESLQGRCQGLAHTLVTNKRGPFTGLEMFPLSLIVVAWILLHLMQGYVVYCVSGHTRLY